MTAITVVSIVGLSLLTLEAVSWALARLSSSVFSIPIPNRADFLADQTEKLRRLLHDPTMRAKIHPVRGWKYDSSRVSDTEHISRQGVRSLRDYAPEPAPGTKRIAAFGDSYVYCAEVGDGETWPHLIEAGWNAEVLNYGIGGYGADQAFLRFQDDGLSLKPQIVIMGFTALMGTRMVSRYRRFEDPRDGVGFKPRFAVEGDELRFIPAPVTTREDAEQLLNNPGKAVEFGKDDFWYHPPVLEHWLYNTSATYRLMSYAAYKMDRLYISRDRIFRNQLLNHDSESFRIMTRMIHDFAVAARDRGAEPIALMLPTWRDVNAFARLGRPSYEPLRARVESECRVIDPVSRFRTARNARDDSFTPGGHYSPTGNAIIAEAVAEALQLEPRA